MNSSNNKILIFGGAFNPVHKGHLFILQKAISYLKPDRVIICVDKTPPWKHESDLVPYSFRIQMINNLFRNKVDYEVYENSQNLTYAVDIIKDIASNNKESDLYYLLGQDQYQVVTYWNKYEVINELATIVCYPRGNQYVKRINDKHILLVDDRIECSSTANRKFPSKEDLGEENYNLIKKNHLYLQYIVSDYMNDHRYQHTLRVLDTITLIAKGNKFSDEQLLQAQTSAILHDVAKQLTNEQLTKILTQDELSQFPTWHCAHGLAGARLAKHDFNITDKVILDAIENHVIFNWEKAGNNPIAKALYCADKLEPARTKEDIENRQELLDECCKHLDTTFEKVLRLNESKY